MTRFLNVAARSRAGLSEAREQLVAGLMRWAPKRAFSSVVGVAARRQIPRRLRRGLFTAFARRVGANLDEAELPLEDYPTFDAFFTRRLVAGARTIDRDPEVIVAPCDGVVVESGLATEGRMIQAKGRDYRLSSLIPDAHAAGRLDGGAYMTIYLSPRDYHRVHSPVDGAVNGFQHVPGASFPVNAAAVKHVDGLFAINERLVTFVDSRAGDVAVIMVGAAGVGKISVAYDAVTTRSKHGRPGPRVRFASPRRIGRGEELGTFHLGSTVILVFQPGRVNLLPLASGTKVQLGQPIAHRVAAAPFTSKGDQVA